ncbi:transcriptional regulator, TetR family protein [Paenibacillus vortex V453]|jgi:AcrR family transcriptional regulator|uniref:TetR family transcriptional regulator n=2 Tax=Paenibacillus TaxID=44249 RepID=A0A163IC67_9BACL|nr:MULTISPECIES: TetR/AcrR family transcriptional regulator [Paenibacillus]ANA79868.1 TetR family transcriptional regulator [Paenibacillus glucanolyticus]AVV56108.1 TetR family transcriptional regulator [Paenibacillus glucanolyticus]EFU43576.1 transcriptional regulator, TetR family protein [Paenibacillus vortex V453]ETT38248.1 TetR family transcriptional regulator [Paenibacillus sp. FSL R5-808]KZS45893.1 TetR family transcriptional regulator [Paenibacillus glucanolyticus]
MSSEKAQRKRDLILDKAKELFIQRGYAATSMDELVKYTGASKGSIYYHFESKEDLFVKLLAKQNQEWMEGWNDKKAHYTNFEEKLYGIADHMVDDFQNPLTKIAEEFYINQPENKTIVAEMLAILQGPRTLYREIMLEGAREGRISEGDIDEISIIFGSLLDGLSISYYERSQEKSRILYRKGVTYFLKGVLTNGRP